MRKYSKKLNLKGRVSISWTLKSPFNNYSSFVLSHINVDRPWRKGVHSLFEFFYLFVYFFFLNFRFAGQIAAITDAKRKG